VKEINKYNERERMNEIKLNISGIILNKNRETCDTMINYCATWKYFGSDWHHSIYLMFWIQTFEFTKIWTLKNQNEDAYVLSFDSEFQIWTVQKFIFDKLCTHDFSDL